MAATDSPEESAGSSSTLWTNWRQCSPPSLHYFLTVLQNLSDVVGSCFGVAAPPPNYVDIIGKFAASVRQHQDTISFTPTLHAIEKHIIEFFEAEGNFIGIVTQFDSF